MNKYQQLRVIGQGAFSSVIEAIHVPSGERVAIKRMKKRKFNDTASQNEANILHQLKHPNIIHLRESFREGYRYFLVFEYMDLNLHELVSQRCGVPLHESIIQRIVLQILEGITFLHSANYFHRDMKPENLLVRGEYVKIADFGLVREVYSKRPLTSYVSTRWYRAPEILLQTEMYSCPVDMWAIGTIVAEMIRLQPLFPGSTQLDQLQRIFRVLGAPNLSHGPGGAWYIGAVQARKLGVTFNANSTIIPMVELLPGASNRMVQFVSALIQLNPGNRITAKQALE
ncbi:Pkinase-domain-containing protein, partial [Ramicandelaber brevisporus]